MLLFVGLGNPGTRYAGNRHNIGFMAVDAHRPRPQGRPRGAAASRARRPKPTIGGERAILLKPETFMNESGRSVAEAMRFFKIPLGDVVVFHDELDLAPAKLRVKTGGGNAGHNGLRSITALCGNDYRRVRLGIGHPGDKALVHPYVLSDFAKAERDWVDDLCRACADTPPLLAQGRRSRASRTRSTSHGRPGLGRGEGDQGAGLINPRPADNRFGSSQSRQWRTDRFLPFRPFPTTRQANAFNYRTGPPMGFKCGIVGLPNVGKSTLFNALTQTAAAQAANYPFCTIEPNVGDVAVPDPRLEKLAAIAGSAQIIPTRITFVDIAGLVRGASKGEGLGNQFLANIREVDAIAHVVRCFEDGDITHVEGKIDPIADIETIETELMLADLESLEKRVTSLEKKARGGDKEAKEQLDMVQRCLTLLREGKPARVVERKPEEERTFQMLNLLTAKPVLYVCNVEEAAAHDGNAFSAKVFERAKEEGAVAVVVSAQDRERDRRPARPRSRPSTWKPSASTSRASTA